MSRRDNHADRCARCRMHASLCVCALTPFLETRTKLCLVIHRREDRKPTNTGRIAALCLQGSQVVVRGNEESPADRVAIPDGHQPLLLFPHEDARDLREFAGSSDPVLLIVPDGNWRQASKVRQRVEGVSAMPCVTLPKGAPSRYRLRLESHDGGLATVEAIARAFGILEGPHVESALVRVFDAVVERTLWARGEIATAEVTSGIPEGAQRHDPRSGLDPLRLPVPISGSGHGPAGSW